MRVTLAREARHGASPGPTCTEEALGIWERIHEVAETRTADESGFAKLDCRLEAMQGGMTDGLIERAELRVGYRIPPGIATRDLAAEVAAICARHDGGANVTVETVAAEDPARTSRTTPLARAFVASIGEVGAHATFKVKSGTSDMNILAPAWGCPMVAYGPGDSRYDHTPIERLPLADYGRSIAVLKDVLRRAASR